MCESRKIYSSPLPTRVIRSENENYYRLIRRNNENANLFNLFERITTFPRDHEAYLQAEYLLNHTTLNLKIKSDGIPLLKYLLLPLPSTIDAHLVYDKIHLSRIKHIINLAVTQLDNDYLKKVILPDIENCNCIDNNELTKFMIKEIKLKSEFSQEFINLEPVLKYG